MLCSCVAAGVGRTTCMVSFVAWGGYLTRAVGAAPAVMGRRNPCGASRRAHVQVDQLQHEKQPRNAVGVVNSLTEQLHAQPGSTPQDDDKHEGKSETTNVVTWKFMQPQNHGELCGRRMLSPALFSYRWPLNALCSGTHRATGVALVIGFGGIMLGGLSSHFHPAMRQYVKRYGGGWAGYVIRWCVAFPMLYHMLAGLRHLAWDYGLFGFDMNHCHQSSVALLGTSFLGGSLLSMLKLH
ncbi:mitochondrial succinate dehydrogenase complex subunit C [Pelomyxa schiedti]|nr:mitochondrial succinate dehydrogenase complex subunit C [Pelomyxa schiedti]